MGFWNSRVVISSIHVIHCLSNKEKIKIPQIWRATFVACLYHEITFYFYVQLFVYLQLRQLSLSESNISIFMECWKCTVSDRIIRCWKGFCFHWAGNKNLELEAAFSVWCNFFHTCSGYEITVKSERKLSN